MFGNPYIVDYWPSQKALKAEDNELTKRRMRMYGHSEAEILAQFKATGIRHVHVVIEEATLQCAN